MSLSADEPPGNVDAANYAEEAIENEIPPTIFFLKVRA